MRSIGQIRLGKEGLANVLKLKEIDKCAIIIQARMASGRFPGKMLSKIYGNTPLIAYMYKRCTKSSIKKILVATSNDKSDDILFDYCKENNIPVTRGSLSNALKRYIEAAGLIRAKYIVRVCGDTPFVDISLIDILAKILIDEKLDYVSPDRKTCLSGFYSETIALQALEKVSILTDSKEDVEHVTKFITENTEKFLIKSVDAGLNPEFAEGVRLTIDYPEDISGVRAIIGRLKDKFNFTSKEILDVVNTCGISAAKDKR
jgi:spore coat polysaccharide biosynthesis protein SpsF (cytidylyltransferase family)